VSYDHPARRLPLAEQIAEARSLFARYPKQRHSLLLKPTTKAQQYLEAVLKSVAEAPGQLGGFHLIGVTEKELGTSLLERMQRIRVCRNQLVLDRCPRDWEQEPRDRPAIDTDPESSSSGL
jgi:hypothetical protein